MRRFAFKLPRRRPSRGLAALLAGLAVLLALVAILVGTHPGRTAVRTLFFFPEMFPNPPVRPLTWISATPRCEEVTLRYADTQAISDLCYPPGGGPYGGIVLTLGVHPLDRHDPFLVQLHDGLVRTNMAVLRPESPDLTAGRIVPHEIDGLVAAFERLQAQPHVDPARVGLVGFSVGGALATVAAADPRIHDEVHLVNSFGAYYDAFAVLLAITSGQIHYDGIDRPWNAHHWTVEVFARQIINALPPGDERDYLLSLAKAPAEAGPPPMPLSPVGQMLYALVVEGQRVDGEVLLEALPPASRETFRRLSPATHVANLRTAMYVMHDVGDTLIPYTESRKLIDNLPPAVPRRYAEFSMFEHVQPRDAAEMLGFVPDLVELYRHLYLLFLALTD